MRPGFPVFWLLIAMLPFSATGGEPVGARAAGMSFASVTLKDHWGTFNNQAGLAGIRKFSGGFYAEKRFGLKELNSGAITLAIPLKKYGTLGLSYYQFNNSVFYSFKNTGISYSRFLGEKVRAGIQLDLINIHVEGFKNFWLLNGELGLIFSITEQLDLGIHIFNPHGQEIDEFNLPVIFRLGAGYAFSENFSLYVEGKKESDQKFRSNLGLEYKVLENLKLRGGLSYGETVTTSFGAGVKIKDFVINFAFSIHQSLGFTPSTGAEFQPGSF